MKQFTHKKVLATLACAAVLSVGSAGIAMADDSSALANKTTAATVVKGAPDVSHPQWLGAVLEGAAGVVAGQAVYDGAVAYSPAVGGAVAASTWTSIALASPASSQHQAVSDTQFNIQH
ncbi:hypothetical protein P3T37_005671 [Kitasatospora sp. MAA4]|uniref:hypothetical protein n=1 Tax=Kitasatospora sp. MAA4 TaxID=3035093 RepID=UPI002476F243|nr:hypothetical protein [Kitasatospora sp. MAA4]MDH6136251.1 hypothetical protein [Kitasatospora sp. MAA4]